MTSIHNTALPLWYLRSDSNIVTDKEAISLRSMSGCVNVFKENTDETNASNKKTSLTTTCFMCSNEATHSTGTTGSYPLCSSCL